MEPTKKKKSKLFKMQYFGYCMSQFPDEATVDDFVKYCKFHLSVKNNVLMKDPIWDSYTKEEILIEYYAHQFETNEKARTDFEALIKNNEGEINEFANWADSSIAKQKKDLGDLEDRIEFDPKNVMGE